MTTQEIRKTFIEFFRAREHVEIPNSSLVPEHDPTLLFINAGMAPIKNYFLGLTKPPSDRLVNVQRCLRTEDLEKVGHTAGHLTFFEMLGSWSIGGYGKNEAVHFAYDLLTGGFKLDPNRLYTTVFAGDENAPEDNETADAWLEVGIPVERILRLPAEDNFWTGGPVGPCGPCTEVLYDRGEAYATRADSAPKNDSGRFMEIWNAGVFMQYNRQEDGSLEPLPMQSVDTGAGVERLATVLQKVDSVYETNIFVPIINSIEVLADQKFGVDSGIDPAFRIIADHARSITFAIADGILPSNIERGYVVRRLLRRAILHGRDLQIHGYFLGQVAEQVIETMGEEYPHLHVASQTIATVIREEEAQFGEVLVKGEKELKKGIKAGETEVSGKLAFLLYDTHGLPLSVTKSLATEMGLTVDEAGFGEYLEKQKSRSREAGLDSKKAMAALGPEVAKNHSAAHLLNEALRRVVDSSIKQAGQNLNAERLRFDFTFPRALTAEELVAVEKEVQMQINLDLPVTVEETTFEEAKAQGAQALFADKYRSVDRVTLYSFGDYSRELCGGPHVTHTGEIKEFKILKQEAVGRSVRRIKAVAR